MVRYIGILKGGNSYGVGLDACEICGPTGYYEKDGHERPRQAESHRIQRGGWQAARAAGRLGQGARRVPLMREGGIQCFGRW